MPLTTEASKSKVSLASLSASTAAAAESLWSRSKKSSKRRQKPFPDSTPEVSSNNPSTNPLIKANSTSPSPVQPQPLDRNEFRRKFLEGLQFYCENSSLILNSDLPADLIEFVTSHGFSVESLGIILELKKSSSAFSSYADKKPQGDTTASGVRAAEDPQVVREQNFSETSRRLLQHWMSADSCAEAFVSLSLGEEIPGLIAECASFQRILFAVPDNFHLPGDDFLNFLLGQLLLAINVLVYGLKNATPSEVFGGAHAEVEPIIVRTQVIAAFLDRIFMRYFSDAEHFYSLTLEKHESNSFQNFVFGLYNLCKDSAIGKRIVSKIFLHLGSHSASKLAKVVFASWISENEKVPSGLLSPASEFLEKNTQWKFILQTLPIKTVTKSKLFWLNWAHYVGNESCYLTEYWHKSIDHWIVLNKSPLVDESSLYSTSLAIAALAKQIKMKISSSNIEKEEVSQYIWSLELGNVLQNIIHSLESINESRRACGMAIGQIVADLQLVLPFSNDESNNGNDLKKLKFECKAEMFINIVGFYEDASVQELDTSLRPCLQDCFVNPHKIEVLDSDDDDITEDDVVGHGQEDDGFRVLGEEPVLDNREIGIDPRILTLRARRRKIPMYFSEIVETLLEKAKEEDEAQILQSIVVLKVPVLLFMGVRIDARMATTIARCYADIDDSGSLDLPIILGLHELLTQHPAEVTDILAHAVFDRNSYALGQRLMNLNRLTQIARLSSKQSCYNCFGRLLEKHLKELLGIYPEFIEKYLHSRMKLRVCQECRSYGVINSEEKCDTNSSDSVPVEDEQPLTWRQIVDRRVAAKTRYFVTPRSKTVVTVPDEYSSQLLPILWSSVANRLTSDAPFYMDKNEREKTGKMNDIFLVKIFQYLAGCVMGTSGPSCPHIRNLSSHAGELIRTFSFHEDAIVRRAVLSLLGVVLSVGEGKTFVLEALSSQKSILETVEQLINVEEEMENRRFLQQIQQCLASYATAGLLKDLSLE